MGLWEADTFVFVHSASRPICFQYANWSPWYTFFCFLPQMLFWNHKQVSWEVSWVNVSVLFQQDPLDYRSSVIRAPESLPWNRQFWEGTRIFRCTAWLEVLKSAREKSIIDLFSPSPVSDFSFPLSYSPTTHYCQYPSPVSHSAFEVP